MTQRLTTPEKLCDLTSQPTSRSCHCNFFASFQAKERLGSVAVFKALRHEFDPLDRELLERAFYAAWATVRENEPSAADFENDKSLAAILRCKLIEIAHTVHALDSDTLRDTLLMNFDRPTS